MAEQEPEQKLVDGLEEAPPPPAEVIEDGIDEIPYLEQTTARTQRTARTARQDEGSGSVTARPRRVNGEIKKDLQPLSKTFVKALPGLLQREETIQTALRGAAIEFEGYRICEAFHVVRCEQTVGTKRRLEVTLSLSDYKNKISKAAKAMYKFRFLAVSYVCICTECKHPRNPLIVNPEMKRKIDRSRRDYNYTTRTPRAGASSGPPPSARPLTSRARSATVDDSAGTRSEGTRRERSATSSRIAAPPAAAEKSESSSTLEEAQPSSSHSESSTATPSGLEDGGSNTTPSSERKIRSSAASVSERSGSIRRENKDTGRAQDKLKGGVTPRDNKTEGSGQLRVAEIFSKQNNPYEYNSYDVYVEPCACLDPTFKVDFLLRTEISNKMGVSIGMLLLSLGAMGVPFALYADGAQTYTRKMFSFDLLSTHEQNMSMKTM